MKKCLAVFLTLLLVLVLCAGCSGGAANSASAPASKEPVKSEPLKLRVGHAAFETSAVHKGWLKFKEVIETESKGSIQVEIFPAGQLGGDRELTELVQMGELHFATNSSTPLAPFDPEYYVLDIPFLFSDRQTVYTILDGQPGQMLLDSLQKVGLYGLGHMENGFRQVSNSRNEIRTPNDLKGLKLRTMDNKIHMKFWSLCGANPTPMQFGEVFTALQQKVIDGQENPFDNIYQAKMHEIQKYISRTNHLYTPFVAFTNLQFWNSLTPEQQKIIQEGAKAGVEESRKKGTEADTAAEKAIEAYGVKITNLTKGEVNAFRTTMSPILEDIKPLVSPEVMDAFLKATNYQQ